MGYVTSSISAYVDQLSTELLVAVQTKEETAELPGVHVRTGIKGTQALNIVTYAPIAADGQACGYTATGSTTFSQRNITTKAVKYQQTFCNRDLQGFWTEILLKQGQNASNETLYQSILDNMQLFINAKTELIDWQGDTNSSDAYLARYDGLQKIIAAASGTVTATPSTYNSTNARTIIQNIISKIPAALKGNPNVKILMSYANYEIYVNKIATDNLFNAYDPKAYGEIRAENSPYMIKAVHGLDGFAETSGSKFIFALDPSNLYLGVDMESEDDEFKVWYSQDNDEIRTSVRYRRGWQIGIPSEIVTYANT